MLDITDQARTALCDLGVQEWIGSDPWRLANVLRIKNPHACTALCDPVVQNWIQDGHLEIAELNFMTQDQIFILMNKDLQTLIAKEIISFAYFKTLVHSSRFNTMPKSLLEKLQKEGIAQLFRSGLLSLSYCQESCCWKPSFHKLAILETLHILDFVRDRKLNCADIFKANSDAIAALQDKTRCGLLVACFQTGSLTFAEFNALTKEGISYLLESERILRTLSSGRKFASFKDWHPLLVEPRPAPISLGFREGHTETAALHAHQVGRNMTMMGRGRRLVPRTVTPFHLAGEGSVGVGAPAGGAGSAAGSNPAP